MVDLEIWGEFSSSTYNLLAIRKVRASFVPTIGGIIMIDEFEASLNKRPVFDLDENKVCIDIEFKSRGITPHEKFTADLVSMGWRILEDYTNKKGNK